MNMLAVFMIAIVIVLVIVRTLDTLEDYLGGKRKKHRRK
jgi:hypothetical protein